ncbi:hypothetical protein RND81_10G046500 [Saponaria officinalis]|uniref:Replication protein A OB domain-containing protein n=1 Tax=Saponaria officinalis TaxID=3572 RepID=A0AAW1HYE1_SAPOF
MAIPKISLSDVTDKSSGFTVTAKLDSLLPAKKSYDGSLTMQRLLFRDIQGTEMNATLFDQDIDLFAEIFHMGKVYEMTNPKIKHVPEEIIRGGHKYQMVIRSTTKVVEISADFNNEETNIVPVNSMLQHVAKTGRFAITAIVIAVRDLKKISAQKRPVEYDARDLIVVDKNLQPATLTVWHDQLLQQAAHIEELLASIPVIHVTRIRASTFAGGYWSTSTYSVIRINSDDPDVQELYHWYSLLRF